MITLTEKQFNVQLERDKLSLDGKIIAYESTAPTRLYSFFNGKRTDVTCLHGGSAYICPACEQRVIHEVQYHNPPNVIRVQGEK